MVLPREGRGQGTLLGDGTFVNLDFESANIPRGPSSAPIAVSQALPGWTVYLGNTPSATVIPNDSSLAGANVSVLTPQWLVNPIFQGNYMVLLQAAPSPSSFTPTTAALGQTGQIPAGAKNMLFDAVTTGQQVTFNGAVLPVVVYAKTANFNVYEANISALAGETGELRFTVLQVLGTGATYLDNIGFYGQSVPEPGTLALFAFGGLTMACATRRGRIYH
jgi:hypothetical protein